MAVKDIEQLNNILDNFINALVNENIDFLEIYLFGSYYNGNADKWSDIDIAVIVNEKYDTFELQLKIMKLSRNIDIDIEPHVFNKKNFNENHPVFYNIIKNSKKIA